LKWKSEIKSDNLDTANKTGFQTATAKQNPIRLRNVWFIQQSVA